MILSSSVLNYYIMQIYDFFLTLPNVEKKNNMFWCFKAIYWWHKVLAFTIDVRHSMP
ncbi:hypothetical protein HMPREF0653_01540 [Prevotella disiens JCM 6334 = ATCC 29426]|uniref:Uncharacterized protein n=1 Tax=Prevotella disiens JCM 6334 = ATCC 29426 TaxID=1235811 RepID=A0ABP2Y6R7_9BACT|nr:hypothetical protein HMPREF0653_01540 [Prevotella disiens JCM 6334 = ATCC 29426]